MASGLTCRLALVCAPPTASILCRSRPPCSTGISWPRSRIRACPGKGRGLVGGYHRYPDRRGWLYLAVSLDRFTRKIVGWARREHMRAELTIAALTMAVQRRRPRAGLIHHADRGSQYAASDYRNILQAAAITPSMSRKPNCRDNAPIESVFGTLKPNSSISANTPTAMPRDLVASIEAYYNRRPIHSAIAYITPEQRTGKPHNPVSHFPGGRSPAISVKPTLTSRGTGPGPSRRAFPPVISVITITGIGDHLRPEWPIIFTGMRTLTSKN